jgi:hypothetical protein
VIGFSAADIESALFMMAEENGLPDGPALAELITRMATAAFQVQEERP